MTVPNTQTSDQANDNSIVNETGTIAIEVGGLYKYYSEIEDKRSKRGKQYSLALILTCVTFAKLAGETNLRGITAWVRLRGQVICESLKIPLRYKKDGKAIKMPCASTYIKILDKVVGVERLEWVMSQYGAGIANKAADKMRAIDGKKILGTSNGDKVKGEYLLAIYAPQSGVVLAQVEIGNEEGELTLTPKLLSAVDLQGKIVTDDALFAQRNLCLQIVEAGGDYVFKVRGNQAKLQDDIAHCFLPEHAPKPGHGQYPNDHEIAQQTSSAHGRIECRQLTTSCLLQDYTDWPHHAQVFKYECWVTHKKTGKQTYRCIYGITSLDRDTANATQLLSQVRSHWQIETGLHYRRDVSLREDNSSIRTPKIARIMAAINNLTLALFSKSGFSFFPDAARAFCANPQAALKLILEG